MVDKLGTGITEFFLMNTRIAGTLVQDMSELGSDQCIYYIQVFGLSIDFLADRAPNFLIKVSWRNFVR
jgi:hypothetical protein